MKKKRVLFFAVVMAAGLCACSGTAAESYDASASGGIYADLEPVELIGADCAGKDAVGQLFGELVARNVEEITGGKLTIDYHPNGDLGGDEDLLRQMRFNDIHLISSQIAPMTSFVQEAAVFDLPMVFARYDGETIHQVLNGEDSEFRQKLCEAYEKENYKLLGILQNATYRLTTANVDLNEVEDFKGLQIRTMSNNNHMLFWSAIGAEPTPLAFSELYFALQSGTIDAEENAADSIVGVNLHEVQKVLACTNHILYANQIVMSKEAYDTLEPAYQAALTQAVAEAIEEMRPKLNEIDVSNKEILVEKGMTMIEYENSFFDEILGMDTVKQLYQKIDSQVNGLGTVLQNSLEEEAK